MRLQRERARKARIEQGDLGWEEDALAGEHFEETFVGYTSLSAKSPVLYILKDGQPVQSAAEGDEVFLVLETTPFYAESGGQVGDSGEIRGPGGVFAVADTKKSPTGYTLHIGKVASGSFKAGELVTAEVDQARRRAITRNHTGAHLLQAALREVLGTHVHQAGQMVDDEICRFDFSHFAAVSSEELRRVERRINELALSALPVTACEMSMDDAKAKGALALFGSKYSDTVRVVDISGQSAELCGGIHVSNTAELGLLKILHESSVAAGVRRIEAVTGFGVLRFLDDQQALMLETCQALKLGSPGELPAKAAALSAQLKSLQRQNDELTQKMASLQTAELTENLPQIGPVRLLTSFVNMDGVPALKAMADTLKEKHPDIVGVVASGEPSGGKFNLIAFAGKDAVAAGIHAGKLMQAVSKAADGSGGGRPDNAMGGASNPEKLKQALALADDMVKAQLEQAK